MTTPVDHVVSEYDEGLLSGGQLAGVLRAIAALCNGDSGLDIFSALDVLGQQHGLWLDQDQCVQIAQAILAHLDETAAGSSSAPLLQLNTWLRASMLAARSNPLGPACTAAALGLSTQGRNR